MKQIELKGVKSVNIRGVFDAVARRGSASRAEIAADTGLSVMTVGKLVDAFREAGVFSEEKEVFRQAAGRKAGIVSLRRDAYAAIIDLSERTFKLHILDFTLKYYEGTTFTYNRSFDYEENFLLFLKCVKKYLSSRPYVSSLYGIGIAVPGSYNAEGDNVVNPNIPELALTSVKGKAEQVLGRKIDIVCRSAEAAALSYVSDKDKDHVVVGLLIGDAFDSAIYSHGSFIEGMHGVGVDIGSMVLSGDNKLRDTLPFCSSDTAIFNEISLAIYNIIAIIDPDAFVIECPRMREPDYFISRIENMLTGTYGLPEERQPEFYIGKRSLRHISRGIAGSLRDIWLDKNVIN